MPFNLKEIASIAGMSGLYRIVKPTRTGVIIESLEESPVRSVAQARQRISLLDEISIYTNDEESTVPLAEVFDRIRQKYGQDLPVHPKSSGAELSDFLEEVLPDYDQEKVYTSDMKKIVTWYGIVGQHVPYTEASEATETTKATGDTKAEAEEEEPAAKADQPTQEKTK